MGAEADHINSHEYVLFGVFALIIIAFLVIDLGFLSRKSKIISTRQAIIQSAFWVSISFIFGLGVWYYDSQEHASQYFAAYLTEYALSVDNIFVIILILRYFKVEEQYYHKVLFWGILGAIVMRAIFIFLGAALVKEFHWVLYLFGFFLVYSGFKMLAFDDDDKELDAEANPVMKFARRVLPFTNEPHQGMFTIKKHGKTYFTSLFLVILLIESTDLLFAVDSIPAAFVISQNEFVIYTSNIFAVLGLRAMFFMLSGVLDRFYLLQKGLSLILIFIGGKMLAEIFDYRLPTQWSLLTIVLLLGGSVVLSMVFPKKEQHPDPDPSPE